MDPKEMPLEVVVLGTGTSYGVPMIGCDCAVCKSSDPHDRRTRTSIWVRTGPTCLLVDTAPELRLQCIANGIDRADAVLFTHHHADHVSGVDDLRRFNWMTKAPVPCYGTQRTLEGLAKMFSYAFTPAPDSPHSRPKLELHPIDAAPFTVGAATVIPIPMMHGPLPVLGFRIGRFAYCTDCSHIPDESVARLANLDVLILGAPLRKPHPAHFNLDQAVAMAQRIAARQTYFTHITHYLGHEATSRGLPDGISLAYDGQRVRLS